MSVYHFRGVSAAVGEAGITGISKADVRWLHKGMHDCLDRAVRCLEMARDERGVLTQAERDRYMQGALDNIASLDARIAEAADGYQRGFEGADSSRRSRNLVGLTAKARQLRNFIVTQLGLDVPPI